MKDKVAHCRTLIDGGHRYLVQLATVWCVWLACLVCVAVYWRPVVYQLIIYSVGLFKCHQNLLQSHKMQNICWQLNGKHPHVLYVPRGFSTVLLCRDISVYFILKIHQIKPIILTLLTFRCLSETKYVNNVRIMGCFDEFYYYERFTNQLNLFYCCSLDSHYWTIYIASTLISIIFSCLPC